MHVVALSAMVTVMVIDMLYICVYIVFLHVRVWLLLAFVHLLFVLLSVIGCAICCVSVIVICVWLLLLL